MLEKKNGQKIFSQVGILSQNILTWWIYLLLHRQRHLWRRARVLSRVNRLNLVTTWRQPIKLNRNQNVNARTWKLSCQSLMSVCRRWSVPKQNTKKRPQNYRYDVDFDLTIASLCYIGMYLGTGITVNSSSKWWGFSIFHFSCCQQWNDSVHW